MLRLLIVGQGLAGSWLAWTLHHRGHRVVLMQDPLQEGSSRMAAGLINPVTGLRWVKTWRAEVLLNFCTQAYRAAEQALTIQCFTPKTIMRFLRNPEEASQVCKRLESPDYAAYLGHLWPPGQSGVDVVADPWGGCAMLGGATVRLPLFLTAIQEFFKERGLFIAEQLQYSSLKVSKNTVIYAGDTFDRVIFCEGAAARVNPWFPTMALKPSQGEILTIRTPGDLFPENLVLLQHHWVTPWSEGCYRVGATYSWDLSSAQTAQAQRTLLASFNTFFPNTAAQVVEQDSGIRPNSVDTRPLLGFHLNWPSVGFVNGLGSKGSLWAPYLAHHFCEVMEGSTLLDPNIDIQRFFV